MTPIPKEEKRHISRKREGSTDSMAMATSFERWRTFRPNRKVAESCDSNQEKNFLRSCEVRAGAVAATEHWSTPVQSGAEPKRALSAEKNMRSRYNQSNLQNPILRFALGKGVVLTRCSPPKAPEAQRGWPREESCSQGEREGPIWFSQGWGV